MKRLSHALISIVLAALLLVTAVLPAFAGGERDPFIPQPMIGYFYPDYYRGYPGEPPCIYWDSLYGQTIAIYVNGECILRNTQTSGSLRLTELRKLGTYVVKLVVSNVTDDAETSFVYNCVPTERSYTVKYLDEKTGEEVRPSFSPEFPPVVGSTVTETAPDVPDYLCVSESPATITIDNDETKNVITFLYRQVRFKTDYTVRCLDKATLAPIAEDVVKKGYVGDSVTESAPAIPGYALTGSSSAELLLKDDAEKNVITFLYDYSGSPVSYRILCLERGTDAELAAPKTVTGAHAGNRLTVPAPAIGGYSVFTAFAEDPYLLTVSPDPAENDVVFYYVRPTSYIVRYVEQGSGDEIAELKRVDGMLTGDVVTEEPVDVENFDPTGQYKTLILRHDPDLGFNVFTFEYVRVDTSYVVRYVDRQSGLDLAEPKNVSGVKAGLAVTEEAPELPGVCYEESTISYVPVRDASKNVIIFYYTSVHTDPDYPRAMVGYFFPDYYSGTEGESPMIYWDAPNSLIVDIYVNGVCVLHSLSETGKLRLTQLRHPGSYIVKLIAFGVVDNAEGSFVYRCESASDPDGGLNPTPDSGNPTSPKTGRGAELWALLPLCAAAAVLPNVRRRRRAR